MIRTLRIGGVVEAALAAVVGGFEALSRLELLDPEEAQLLAHDMLTLQAVAGQDEAVKKFVHAYGPFFNRVIAQLHRHRDDAVLAYWLRQMRDVARLLEAELSVKVRQGKKGLQAE